MTPTGEWRCRADELGPGRTLKFRLRCGERDVEGFVVNHAGGYRAWLNRCPHVGTPLDLWPNEFYTEDGAALVCSTHGAIFEPLTGHCTGGPCAGDRLGALPLRREGEALVVGCPAVQ